MTERTITESELETVAITVTCGSGKNCESAWAVLSVEEREMARWSARDALEAIGFTFVPVPMLEPKGDVIVRDRNGIHWEPEPLPDDNAIWWDCAGGVSRSWEELLRDNGTLAVYKRRQEVTA